MDGKYVRSRPETATTILWLIMMSLFGIMITYHKITYKWGAYHGSSIGSYKKENQY